MSELLLASALLLAFVNGANDNLKGVATLYGSGALSYRGAVGLATASTGLGSLLSVFVAGALVTAFSGKGVVPEAVLDPGILTAVALGAAVTILLATRLGFPVSTTHALLGALAGAGAVEAWAGLSLVTLARSFALPLIASPVMAVGLAWLLHRGSERGGRRLGIDADSCVCLHVPLVATADGRQSALLSRSLPALRIGDARTCDDVESGSWSRLPVASAIASGHLISGSLVGFARGLNDTPKILGLLAGASLFEPLTGALLVGGCMALGGFVAARRVTETLANGLTKMSPGQGLAANLASSMLVIGASRLGVPVSTTHVTAGGIVGVGASSSKLRWRATGEIFAAWVITLPTAAAFAAACAWLLG